MKTNTRTSLVIRTILTSAALATITAASALAKATLIIPTG